jgi:hypothetical protein
MFDKNYMNITRRCKSERKTLCLGSKLRYDRQFCSELEPSYHTESENLVHFYVTRVTLSSSIVIGPKIVKLIWKYVCSFILRMSYLDRVSMKKLRRQGSPQQHGGSHSSAWASNCNETYSNEVDIEVDLFKSRISGSDLVVVNAGIHTHACPDILWKDAVS